MTDKVGASPDKILASYKAADTGLYFVGMFSTGVTVLSQQVRALNLAWGLIESKTILCLPAPPASGVPAEPSRVAVIGGGFAGLTFAAGLLAKRANARITIFEQRD